MELMGNNTRSENLPLWAQLRKNHGFATPEELKEFEVMVMKDAGANASDTSCTSASEATCQAYCQDSSKDACSGACQSNCEKGASCQSGCEGNLEHHNCPTNCEQACLGPCENSTVSQ